MLSIPGVTEQLARFGAEGKWLALSVPLLRQRDQLLHRADLGAAGTTTRLGAALIRLIGTKLRVG
jgi:hypothetical protein